MLLFFRGSRRTSESELTRTNNKHHDTEQITGPLGWDNTWHSTPHSLHCLLDHSQSCRGYYSPSGQNTAVIISRALLWPNIDRNTGARSMCQEASWVTTTGDYFSRIVEADTCAECPTKSPLLHSELGLGTSRKARVASAHPSIAGL